MIDRKQSKHLDDVSAGRQPAETNGDVAALLAEIVTEVENRGLTGHWMNPSSPLIARARLALLNANHRGENKPPTMELALRDLVWRVEHVRNALSSQKSQPERRTLIELLGTDEARSALGCETSTQ